MSSREGAAVRTDALAAWEHDGTGSREGIGQPLSLLGVRKTFDDVVAVDDFSLHVAAGEFLTLLGASGSGKTTTLMMVAGFQPPDAGEIRLGGIDITATPVYRRNLGMVYQNYALFPHMTVEGNVAFPLEMRGLSKRVAAERVGQALELVQLAGYEKRMPVQLSGGQQQRVALARALVFEPPVLLLDEPLGALDKKLRVEMQREITRIQKALGITTIYVTHDQEEALTMSDRVVVMDRGAVEQLGTPREIYERPANAFVAHFMGATNVFEDAMVEGWEGGVVTARSRGGATFKAAPPPQAKEAQRGTLVIRPECVRLGDASEAEWYCRGEVLDVVYTGSLHRYRVRLNSDEEVVALKANDMSPGHAAREAVDVWWPADRGWFIPAES